MLKKEYLYILAKVLPIVAFAIPLTLLYFLNPMDNLMNISAQDSFQLMWKGRTFQLFFIWLVILEFILSWENIKLSITNAQKTRFFVYGLFLVFPTVFVLGEYYLGLNAVIANWATQIGVPFSDSMPLALEYLVLALLFSITISLSYGKKALNVFALPTLFMALVGFLYTVDNVFPYGQFTPFQLLVPTTASLAAGVLGLLGYGTIPGTELGTGMPTLQVTGPLGTAKFSIAWPCAGIESLLIFTAVALLFLKRMKISWKTKIGFFVFGSAVTYSINVLRIVNIFILGTQYGVDSSQVQSFHFYLGPLYAMAWIISYPLILLGGLELWGRLRSKKLQPIRLNPA